MNAPPIDYRFTYRAQLDRIRRMRRRFDDPHENMQVAQDIMWSFFQHCWHLKDWVVNDLVLTTKAQRDGVEAAAHASNLLMLCRGLCNATKHLDSRPGEARHSHMNANIGAGPRMEIIIDDGSGNKIRGHHLADRCIAEWNTILAAHGLSTQPLPL
jgi:hypothetical protein